MLLQRYLPKTSLFGLDAWLSKGKNQNRNILDPFGISPTLAIEIAKRGYNVLVSANNPINRFLIEITVNPPTHDELTGGLAALSATRRGKDRLEPHILSLYETTCDSCQQKVSAKYFVWERGAEYPLSKWVTCPQCGFDDESSVTDGDRKLFDQFRNDGLHRARALESIVPKDNEMRPHVEEALSIYPPRAVYALFTILNKFEILTIPKEQKRALELLLLLTLDRSSKMWSVQNPDNRPLHLKTPKKYYEYNVWHSLEKGMEEIDFVGEEIEVSIFPEIPQEGGISLFNGPMREMDLSLSPQKFNRVATAIPYPNQAFWKLSALWSGWLFGKASISGYLGVIKRKRFDWKWHAVALSETLKSISKKSSQKIELWISLNPIQDRFVQALFFALIKAKITVSQFKYSYSPVNLIIEGKSLAGVTKDKNIDVSKFLFDIVKKKLLQLAQPASYSQLLPDILAGLSVFESKQIFSTEEGNQINEYQTIIKEIFRYRNGFVHLQSKSDEISYGKWWLKEPPAVHESLDDRVEKWLIRQLVDYSGQTPQYYLDKMFEFFMGDSCLSEEYLYFLLISYADKADGDWHLRSSEFPKNRQKNIQRMRELLFQIGTHAKYNVSGEQPILWKGGAEEREFYLGASTAVSKRVYQNQNNKKYRYLVIPGGRADLFLHKLNRNPYLEIMLKNRWKIIKFRTLRQIEKMGNILPEQFDEIVLADQLESNDPQLRLI